MNILLALALILSFSAAYMVVIEAFSVAFKLTGLATKKIRFQVASLFTGTGFTTNESDLIVNDERRRKIAITCMYTSHIFSVVIVGLLINLVISFVNSLANKIAFNVETFTSWYAIVFYVSLFLFAVVIFLKIPPIHSRFIAFLEKMAIAMSPTNRQNNIITVIDLYGKDAIAEVILNRIPDFAKDKTLFEMQLTKKYLINILSIRRGNRIIEVSKDTMFAQGDIIVVFGLIADIKAAFVNSNRQEDNAAEERPTNTLTLVNNYGENALVDIEIEEVPQEIDGLPMKDTHLPDKYKINVGMIKRDNTYIVVDKNTVIQKGDKITVFGPYKVIKHLFNND